VSGVRRPRVDDRTVAALVQDAFGEQPLAVDENTDGMYNAVFRIVTDSGLETVLKVSPPPSAPALTYEADLLRSEALFFDATRHLSSFPVPEMLHLDCSHRFVEGDACFSRLVEGETWWRLRRRMPRREVARLRGELGSAVAELHTVTGPSFGYPQPGAQASAPSWREAFTAMVDNILADARRWKVRLPVDAESVRRALARHAHLLDACGQPVLVHFDLWAGNVLLGAGPQGRRISGIVDGERMFFGDPVAEFASLALFGDIEDDRAFLAAYDLGRGTPLVFDDGLRRRLSLYKAYLYLIMVTEAAPRRYPWTLRATVVAYAARKLARELARLSSW